MCKVAVVILNWNGENLLREFLPAVMANTDPETATVYVADNGSTDNSIEVIEQQGARLIRLDRNYGFAGGYNHALKHIREPYTVLLNSDVAPAPGWIAPLYQYIESHPRVGAVQPKVLSYADKTTFEYAGASGGFIDKHGYTYCRGRIFDTCETDRGQYDTVIPIFWATGAALMIRTALYRQAGGLDERFFAHMEEIDLCWRVLLAGYEIMVVPQSVVYHLGGGSLPASSPRKTYLNFRNNLLMLHKNLPDATRARKLIVRRLLDTLAFVKFAVTLDFKNAYAVLRAHRDFAKMRRLYTSHPERDLLDERADTHRDIITGYYLRGRKTYSSGST